MNSEACRRRTPCRIPAIFSFAAASLVALGSAADWPRWRGPQDNGSTESSNLPVTWDESNIVWKAPLPGKGCSTPVVWKDRIFATAPVNGKDAVLAFDTDGNRLWETTFGSESPGKHRNGSGSNASPVTDGDGVFVYFKSGTLAALEFDGSIRWQTNLVERFGRDTLYWDHGTSPVLTMDHVIFARMHNGGSWLAAFDKKTGALNWKVDRNYETPTECDHGYTTPVVLEENGQEAILVWGAEHLTAHSAKDGSLLWECGGFNPRKDEYWPAVASPVVAGDMVVVPYGRADRNTPRLHGVRRGGTGDVTDSHRVWMRDDMGAFVPTPAERGGLVYVLRDRGQIECIDPATGKALWSDEFPRDRANYYASPLVAGDKLYAIREDGVVFVASVGDGFRVLAENKMGERVIASPVPLKDRLLIRGEEHLYCLAAEPAR